MFLDERFLIKYWQEVHVIKWINHLHNILVIISSFYSLTKSANSEQDVISTFATCEKLHENNIMACSKSAKCITENVR